MIQKIPLHHVQVAFADLLAVAVAVRIIHADAGWAPYSCVVLEGFRHKLLSAGVRDPGKAVAVPAGERGRVAGLQTRMNVERRGREGTERGRNRWPQRHVQVAETED